ncbi:DUF2887 domain-containing protein [Thiocapsa marina]|uniref:DUF2887 domain-containing protein n=1 Tax=Thiocapsa marina TaxID=244573 RepID=UPI0038992AFF
MLSGAEGWGAIDPGTPTLIGTPGYADFSRHPPRILDPIETILVYKFPQMTREEIRAMLHLPWSRSSRFATPETKLRFMKPATERPIAHRYGREAELHLLGDAAGAASPGQPLAPDARRRWDR